jgi:transposase
MPKETITMTAREQQRAHALAYLVAGELSTEEAAGLMGLSARHTWRLRARFLSAGPAALVHGNRGRASARRIPDEVREAVLAAAAGRYDGANDTHLAELLAAEEGIALSRVTVRRILRGAGRPSPRRRRAPRHRSRRERMPQAGMLLQVDGSVHPWLEGRGPRLTLLAAVDDATGLVTAATFRDEEDSAGYLEIIRDTARRQGLPLALYRDRHGAFETALGRLPDPDLRLADPRRPTQVGGALRRLGIRSMAAGSAQAKGRIERFWGTCQDRLVTCLRLAGADDRETANRVLGGFVGDFNARFTVEQTGLQPAWREVPAEVDLDEVCAFHYRRVVALDHTVRVGGLVLQLPPLPGRRGYAGRRVDVQLRLDGSLHVVLGGRTLLITHPDLDRSRLRSLERARPSLSRPSPAPRPPAAGYPPRADHPWRRVTPGSPLEAAIRTGEAPASRPTDRFTDQLD